MLHTHASTLPELPFETRKAYCSELLKVMLRYSTPVEVQRLTSLIEHHADKQLANRYMPGLNSARYDLFRRVFLQEAAQ